MEIFIRGLVALGIALAVATIGFSQTPPAAPPAAGAAPAAPATVDNGCGLAPGLKLFNGRLCHFFGGDGAHGWAGKGKGLGGPGDPQAQAGHNKGPRTQPGTLVYPQHPFVRSPRDFFMID